jgi:hypothetical protein
MVDHAFLHEMADSMVAARFKIVNSFQLTFIAFASTFAWTVWEPSTKEDYAWRANQTPQPPFRVLRFFWVT